MRAVVRFFLTLPTKSIWKSLTYKKTSSGRVLINIQRCFSQNLRLFGWEIRELWIIIRNKRSVAASRVGHRARARVHEWQGEEMKATLVFCFSCFKWALSEPILVPLPLQYLSSKIVRNQKLFFIPFKSSWKSHYSTMTILNHNTYRFMVFIFLIEENKVNNSGCLVWVFWFKLARSG